MKGICMRGLIPAALMAMALGIPSQAQDDGGAFLYPYSDPDVVKFVTVKLRDYVTDGCWTNIREVKGYAEEQLRLKGYRVINRGGWNLNVDVLGQRDDDGLCFGVTRIQLGTRAKALGTEGGFALGEELNVYANYQNINVPVLNDIKKVIGGIPGRED